MSYLVLARKYRPRTFEEMVGQEHVVQALTNALTSQRLHHAYLFTGTRGVGKTTVSRILAKSLNCTGSDGQGTITAHPCGVCDACRDIDAGRFVDYVEMDAASNRGVDEISQLLDQAVYKPVTGRFKVYMIDEVHMLSNTAFNAMLKTLEEPPEYLKFVLATTDPQKVPVTVLSRCLQFNLRPMAPQTVQEHLSSVLSQENISAEPGALRELSRAARGSMRDALSLTDQAIAFGSGALQESTVREMLGAVDTTHIAHLLQALATRDGAALIQSCDALRQYGLSPAGSLDVLSAVLQSAAIAQAAPAALDADDPQVTLALEFSSQFAPEELQLFYSMALHGRGELGLAPDEYAGLTMVMLRMLAFRWPAQTESEQGDPAKKSEAAPARGLTQQDAALTAKKIAPTAAARPVESLATVPVVMPPARVPLLKTIPSAGSAPTTASVPTAHQSSQPVVNAASSGNSDDIPPWLDAPMTGWGDDLSAAEAELPSLPLPLDEHVEALSNIDTPAASPAFLPELSPDQQARGDRWFALVKRLIENNAIAALVRELAQQSCCVAVDESGLQWQLQVERDILGSPQNVERLTKAIREALGPDAQLTVSKGPAVDTPAQRDAQLAAQRQADAEREIREAPEVQTLMQQFKTARIVPGSIRPLG